MACAASGAILFSSVMFFIFVARRECSVFAEGFNVHVNPPKSQIFAILSRYKLLVQGRGCFTYLAIFCGLYLISPGKISTADTKLNPRDSIKADRDLQWGALEREEKGRRHALAAEEDEEGEDGEEGYEEEKMTMILMIKKIVRMTRRKRQEGEDNWPSRTEAKSCTVHTAAPGALWRLFPTKKARSV
ncbi:hypothetical protein BKA65DRAFT_484923 [Rhexocercosporidium sp. MPI-PUGE-AT-0058]|nr:hypothetical protein BKA65DRAFT_484923 [Rhexocercosporidium sp. MPI-PUGE-AT-0058]